MKKLLFILSLVPAMNCFAQDTDADFTELNPSSASLRHLLNLLTIHGVPKNQNADDTITILINHGYCVGFSKKYNQPVWTAYQVSKAKKDVDYERFPSFVDDRRLSSSNQVGSEVFGDGFDRGHMAPNAALNKQFGKLAQMETFLMSNICPQKKELNQGVWQRLEAAILNKYANRVKDSVHVWVLVGPIFSDDPRHLTRPNGTRVSIADSFYCILSRPFKFPFDNPNNAQYLSFIFPQNVPGDLQLKKTSLVSINRIEKNTGINFFPNFSQTNQNKIETNAAAALW